MADNVAITAGAGTSVATDDVGGAHYQRVKVDGGGDGLAVPILAGGGVEASALRVTIASDSTGVLSVDDNGATLSIDDGAGSITVDGSVTVSGTVTANLAAGTNNIGDVDVLTLPALAAGTNNIGDVDVLTMPGTAAEAAALPSLFCVMAGDDGIDTQPIQLNASGDLKITLDSETVTLAASTANIGDVDILSIAAGDNNIGNVDIVTMPAVTVTGVSTLAEQQTQTTALQLIDDPVFADDAAFTVGTSKVAMGGVLAVAHGTNPDAADALDAGASIANRHRVPFVIGGHPNIVSAEYITTAAQTDDNILPAIAGGTKYVITSITVAASAANTVSPSVRIGFGLTTVPAQGASGADAVSKVILSHPGIPAGSGIVKGNGSGIVGIGGDGEELRITNSVPTTGSLVVQVDYYTIES